MPTEMLQVKVSSDYEWVCNLKMFQKQSTLWDYKKMMYFTCQNINNALLENSIHVMY